MIATYRCRKDKSKVKVAFNSRGMAKRPRCPKCGGNMALKDQDIKEA